MFHILHIPKTGGTAVRVALGGLPRGVFHCGGHMARLTDVPAGETVVFGIRDPISRFVSGFNSKLRKGQPRNHVEWTPVQQEGFARFPNPNSLAEGLSDRNFAVREWASRLIRDMFHTGVPLSFWFDSVDYLRSRRADIGFIWLQGELPSDFELMKPALGLPADLRLPTDPVGSHVTPPGFETDVSDLAIANLAGWYRGEFAFFEAAQRMRAETIERLAGAPAV